MGKETIFTGLTSGNNMAPTAVSHDGRWLVLTEAPLHSIITLRSREDANKVVRVQDRQTERDGSISPDGRWLLYDQFDRNESEIMLIENFH